MPTTPTATVTVTRTPRRSWYSINNKEVAGEKEAEILLYDEIGGFGISAEEFINELEAITAGRIRVRINTPGGDAFQGTAIYNALKAHPAEIVVQIDGIAASAGSFVAMSGSQVRMADNAYLMIHEARGVLMGEAEKHRTYAGLLDKVNDNISGIYAAKAGKPRRHFRSLMAAETWFTAEEAKDEGLVDVVDKPAKKIEPAKTRAALKVYNMAKVPEAIRQRWDLQPVPSAAVIVAAEEPTQPNNTAPEVLPSGEPPPSNPKETSQMPKDSEKDATANQAAAATTTNVQQSESTAPTAQSVIQGYMEQGRQTGYEQGVKAAIDRFNAIMAACPGKPEMAAAAFVAGQDANTAKLAFEAAKEAEERAKAVAAIREQEMNRILVENNRLNALLAIGGHPGVGNFHPTAEADEEDRPQDETSAKYQAEQEWDRKPSVRRGYTKKENYVNIRTQELMGRFTKQVATADRA